MNTMVLPGKIESLPAIARYVLQAACLAQLDEQAAYRLRLAVDEIVTNIITHGYAAMAGEGSLMLSAVLEESCLLIYLEDTGQHYDPCQAPPPNLHTPPESRSPGGLGIYLARWGVDQVQYERLPNRNRTTFVVQRCCRQQPGGDPPPG